MAGVQVCFSPVVHAVEANSTEQALEIFFQLGFPDTRGAKWVRVFGPAESEEMLLLQSNSGGYTGNAWLLYEKPDGTVELVTPQGKQLRGRRSDKSAGEQDTSSSLPEFRFQPANLEQDLKTLNSALQTGNPPSGEAYEESDESPGYRQNDRLQRSAATLLFMAQLYRNGHAKAVQDLLPKLFAQRISADTILDSAVSMLADCRLERCTQEWVEQGDSEAFAKDLEKLTTEFSKGWKSRDAVVLLASKVREQKPSPAVANPEVKQAADLFLHLTPEQYRALPRGRNWLLGDDADALSEEGVFSEDSEDDAADRAPVTSPNPDNDLPAPTEPLAEFFNLKRGAIEVLARLLDDHRFLRVAKEEDSSSSSYAFFQEGSPEDAIRQAYEQLPRPVELSELAWQLLEQIVPEQIRSQSNSTLEDRSAQVLAWLPEIASLSDEQLAWHFLRKTDDVNDSDFRICLNYLVKHGSPESQTQLQEVFLDPAVWSRGSIDTLVPVLAPYLKRIAAEGDPSAFADKLKAVVTTALETDRGGIFGQVDEATRKYLENQRKAELQKIDQLLTPRRLADMLDELVAAKEEDAQTLLQTIATAAQTAPWSEVEPALYRAAASTKDVTRKRSILGVIQQAFYVRNSRKGGKPEVYPIPSDAPTREALTMLLADESAQEESDEDGDDGGRSVADTTASLLLWSRLHPDEQSGWNSLCELSPQVAAAAIRAHARALVSGQTPPPLPNAATVSIEEVQKIFGELSALPPTQIPAAFRTKSPDQQLALVLHLRDLAEWPTALREAQLTVTRVQANGEKSEILNKTEWKGRRFDDAARHEITAILEKAARENNAITVALQSSSPLSGLTLSVRSYPGHKFPSGRLSQIKIPGLEGKPAPEAVLFHAFRSGSNGEQTVAAGYSSPIWKDSTLNQAWKDQHLTPVIKAATKGAEPSSDEPEGQAYDPFNPRAYEQRLRDTFALKANVRGAFSLQWQVVGIQSTAPDAEEP